MEQQNTRRLSFDDCFSLFSAIVGNNDLTLYDIRQGITRFSPAIVEMLGLPGECIPDGGFRWSELVHPEDRHFFDETMSELFSLRRQTYDLTYRVRLKDGSYHRFRFVGGVIRDAGGQPAIAGGMMVNSGTMENIDHVTALRNINGFFEDLAGTETSGSCRILLFGFGRLAHINAAYGYGYGSRLLRETAITVEKVLGNDDRLYRMDGAKFAVISHSLSEEGMTLLYEKIRGRLREGIELDGVLHNLEVFGGMIESDESPGHREGQFDKAHTLYNCLLHAYEESKRYGGGELIIYNDDRTGKDGTPDRISLIREIRNSIHEDFNGFYLLYQPIFKSPESLPCGAHTRLMWRGTSGGGMQPSRFYGELSHDAAFEKLGYWVLKKALIDGREFLDEDPDFRLHISLPPNFIGDRYFLETAEELAAKADFPLSSLSLLLTKECRFAPMEKLWRFTAGLKEKHLRLGLDDFAAGNDWLQAFRELSPDFVRFPGALTAHIAEDGKDLTIFSHLVDLVKSCGTEIFVRGVASGVVRDILCTLPIDGMQGDALMKYCYYDEVLDLYAAKNTDHK